MTTYSLNKLNYFLFQDFASEVGYACEKIIGASLSKPHTSGKVVCDCPSTEIYDQMRKIVSVIIYMYYMANSWLNMNDKPYKFLRVTKKCDNTQEAYQTVRMVNHYTNNNRCDLLTLPYL